MKRILAFAFATLILVTLTACGGGKKTPEQLIVGSWVASEPAVMNEGGMTITMSDMSATYNKDKTAAGKGAMKMTGPGLPMALEMSMTTESTWVIEGDKLKETITNADIKMITKIPGMPDMSGMIAEQMKQLQDLANKINQTNINSCEAGAALVGSVWPKTDLAQRKVCETIGASNGWYADAAKARYACGSEGKRSETLNRIKANPDTKDLVLANTNLAWTAIKKNAF